MKKETMEKITFLTAILDRLTNGESFENVFPGYIPGDIVAIRHGSKHIWLMKRGEKIAVLSLGNKKLKETEHVLFLIWATKAVLTCPGACAGCLKDCYALAGENAFPSVKIAHLLNTIFTYAPDYADGMKAALNLALKIANKKGKKLICRVHESGDYHTEKYLNDWFLDIVPDFETVRFVTYTKSFSLFWQSVLFDVKTMSFNFPANMSVNASLWDDMPQAVIELVKKTFPKIYTALHEKDFEKFKAKKCRCESCGTCLLCANNSVNLVAVVIREMKTAKKAKKSGKKSA